MIFAIFGVAMCACCAVCHRQVFVLLLLSIMFVVGTAVLSEMTPDNHSSPMVTETPLAICGMQLAYVALWLYLFRSARSMLRSVQTAIGSRLRTELGVAYSLPWI
jgi:hypothetical protein